MRCSVGFFAENGGRVQHDPLAFLQTFDNLHELVVGLPQLDRLLPHTTLVGHITPGFVAPLHNGLHRDGQHVSEVIDVHFHHRRSYPA